MAKFKYRAIDAKGNTYVNVVEAKSQRDCANMLKRNRLQPIKIEEQISKIHFQGQTPSKKKTDINKKEITDFKSLARKEIDLSVFNMNITTSKIKTREIIVFMQQLLTLKGANYNNIEALKVIAKAQELPAMKILVNDMISGLEGGKFMYEVMEEHSKEIPYIIINMVKVGELSGNMVQAIQEGIDYLEKSEEIKKRVKKIIVPNILMFIAIWILLIVSTLIAVPKIQEVFNSVGTKEQLPWLTLAFSRFLDQAIAYWYIPVFTIAAITLVVVLYFRTPKGRFQLDKFKYQMPIFGRLIYMMDFTKLLHSLLLNINMGLKIQDALEISKTVVENQVMTALIEQGINNIYNGESWITPFEDARLGSPMAVDMLNVGMLTDLPAMMEKITELMEQDINEELEKIMKILPEVTYGVVGVVLIFFVVVVLVPLIQVYMGSFLFTAALDNL